MKKEFFPVEVLLFDNELTLAFEDQNLLNQARDAAKTAYAPYSGFKVGAAVLLDNGITVSGSNQENAAYPSGLCAERVAIFYAQAQFPGVAVKAVAITALSERAIIDEPVAPCGSCRQVMAESEKIGGKPIRVIMQGMKGPVMVVESIKSLLPFSFLDDFLIKYAKKND